MPVDVTLLERLPEPVLLVSPAGDTLYGNAAFHRLVSQLGVPSRLAGLFGPPAQVVLAEARRNGSARAFLPLAGGPDSARGYRLEVHGGSEDGTLAVLLIDLSEEVAWRHQLFLRNSELTVLNDIGTALTATLEMDALARRIWEQTGRIMDHANFFIALHERETGRVTFPIWVEDGKIEDTDRSRPFGQGLTEHILMSRQPLLLSGDVSAQLDQMGIERIGRTCVSFIGVPILADGTAMGVMALQDYTTPSRYGRHEMGVLSIVANQAGAAIRNAQLFESARRAYRELSQAQNQLLESERLRGVTETVGALNHEVNNPLATIVGSAQLLLRRGDLEPDLRQKVERMLEAGRRIQQVTGRMATLIQATSRPYPGQTQIIDLRGSIASSESRPSQEPAA